MAVNEEQFDVQEVVSTEELTEEVVEEESNVFETTEEILPEHVKIEECYVDSDAEVNGIEEEEQHQEEAEEEGETYATEQIFVNSGIEGEFEDEDAFVNEVTIEDDKEDTVVSQE